MLVILKEILDAINVINPVLVLELHHISYNIFHSPPLEIIISLVIEILRLYP